MVENLKSQMTNGNLNAEYVNKLGNLTEQLIKMLERNSAEQAECYKKMQEAFAKPPARQKKKKRGVVYNNKNQSHNRQLYNFSFNKLL